MIIVVEELSKIDASAGMLPVAQELGTLPILLAANPAQKKKFLPALSSGEKLSAFALTEASGGSDVARLPQQGGSPGGLLHPERDQNLHYQRGRGGHRHGIRPDESGQRRAQGVERVCGGEEVQGFSVGKKEDKMGIRSSDTVELIFEDCRVPAENMLTGEGMGFSIMMKTLDFSRPGRGRPGPGNRPRAPLSTPWSTPRRGSPLAIQSSRSRAFPSSWRTCSSRSRLPRQLLYKTGAVLQELPKDMSRLCPRRSGSPPRPRASARMWPCG